MASKPAEFIEIINVHTQKTKKMLKDAFLKMPVGKDQTRSGWVEKGKDTYSDLTALIPPELRATGKKEVFQMAADIEDSLREKVEAKVKEELETLRTDNDNLRKVNDTLNDEIKKLRENQSDGSEELTKLGNFLMKNHSSELREGSAVDMAITLMLKQASQISQAPQAGSTAAQVDQPGGDDKVTTGNPAGKKNNSKQ